MNTALPLPKALGGWQSLMISLVLLGVFVAAWHLATRQPTFDPRGLSPLQLQQIVAGLRIFFGSALVAVVPAEMLLGELGVGYLTWIEWNNLHIAGILFAILVIGAVGVALDAGFNRLARLVTYPE
jgi:sterol desaturase/sphingolipid hydroxylase (fatty acid hydroxylase superfamily)